VLSHAHPSPTSLPSLLAALTPSCSRPELVGALPPSCSCPQIPHGEVASPLPTVVRHRCPKPHPDRASPEVSQSADPSFLSPPFSLLRCAVTGGVDNGIAPSCHGPPVDHRCPMSPLFPSSAASPGHGAYAMHGREVDDDPNIQGPLSASRHHIPSPPLSRVPDRWVLPV
jgi:hypothetical protein